MRSFTDGRCVALIKSLGDKGRDGQLEHWHKQVVSQCFRSFPNRRTVEVALLTDQRNGHYASLLSSCGIFIRIAPRHSAMLMVVDDPIRFLFISVSHTQTENSEAN
jgi:hypothetical protein